MQAEKTEKHAPAPAPTNTLTVAKDGDQWVAWSVDYPGVEVAGRDADEAMRGVLHALKNRGLTFSTLVERPDAPAIAVVPAGRGAPLVVPHAAKAEADAAPDDADAKPVTAPHVKHKTRKHA